MVQKNHLNIHKCVNTFLENKKILSIGYRCNTRYETFLLPVFFQGDFLWINLANKSEKRMSILSLKMHTTHFEGPAVYLYFDGKVYKILMMDGRWM